MRKFLLPLPLVLVTCCLAPAAWAQEAPEYADLDHVEWLVPDGQSDVSFTPEELLAREGAEVEEFQYEFSFNVWPLSDIIAVSPDGSRFAFWHPEEQAIQIWEAETGTMVQSIAEGDQNWADERMRFAWNPSCTLIAAKCKDKVVRIWDVASGDLVQSMFNEDRRCWDLAWSPDGSRIAAEGRDWSIMVWDVASGEVVNSLEPKWYNDSEYGRLAWNPDSNRIAFFGELYGNEYLVFLWDVDEGKLLKRWDLGRGQAHVFAWTPDGDRYTTGIAWSPSLLYYFCPLPRPQFERSDLGIFSAEDHELLSVLHADASGLADLVWSPDGQHLLSSGISNAAIWNLETGSLLHVLEGGTFLIGETPWSPDSSRVVTETREEVNLWDVASGELLNTLNKRIQVGGVMWRRNNTPVVIGESRDVVSLWDVAPYVEVDPESLPELRRVAWSPDGTRLVVGLGADNGCHPFEDMDNPGPSNLQIWDAQGTLLQTLELNGGRVTSLDWSSDGARIASGTCRMAMQVWDAERGDLIGTWTGSMWRPDGAWVDPARMRLTEDPELFEQGYLADLENSGVYVSWKLASAWQVAWSPDNTRIAARFSENFIYMVDAATGAPLWSMEEEDRTVSLGWSPDGARLATGQASGLVLIRDAATGEVLETLDDSVAEQVPDARRIGNGPHAYAYWSPDGTRLLERQAQEGLLVLWDPDSGEQLAWTIPQGVVARSLAWSPDSKYIAVGCREGQVLILDAATLDRVLWVGTHPDGVTDLSWHPDGTRLASVGGDLRVWNLEGALE